MTSLGRSIETSCYAVHCESRGPLCKETEERENICSMRCQGNSNSSSERDENEMTASSNIIRVEQEQMKHGELTSVVGFMFRLMN